jgi:hypothetical protein
MDIIIYKVKGIMHVDYPKVFHHSSSALSDYETLANNHGSRDEDGKEWDCSNTDNQIDEMIQDTNKHLEKTGIEIEWYDVEPSDNEDEEDND